MSARQSAPREFRRAAITYAEATAPRLSRPGKNGCIRELPSYLDRFFANVRPEGECWIWTKTLGPKGYAPFYVTSTFQVMAHRFIYELLIAEIPPGLLLDHLCRRPPCVNPWHLEPVTNRENQRRGEHPHAGVALRTNTCHRGHSLADAYIEHLKNGKTGRRCRPCQKARYAAYIARKRAAA